MITHLQSVYLFIDLQKAFDTLDKLNYYGLEELLMIGLDHI